MPLDNEKLKKVYITLKEGGYNQDYNSFVKGFSGNENYGNRKQVYDLLTQNGAQVGKNYADFMQKLYTPSPKAKQTQVQQPRVNRGSMVRAVTDPLNARGIGGVMQNINKVQGVVKKAEKEKANGYQPRFDGVTKRNTETKIPTLAYMKPMPTFDPTPHFETEKSVDADGKIVSKAKPKQIFDGSGQPKYVYQDTFTGKTYDPNDSDPHTQEMIKRGEDAASYVQEAPMPKVTDNDLVGLASSIDKRMHEIALQRNAEAGTSDWSGLDMPRGGGALVGNWYTSTQNGLLADEEYKTLGIAQGALARAHKMVEEAEKSKREGNFSGFIKGAGRGFVDGVFDPETWDFGVSSLVEAGYIKNALDKFDSGQRLSKDEKILLDAKAMEMAVNAFYGSDIGRGYKAGKVTAEAIPFMIEMAINPASGAGKGAASMLTRYALKRFGKKGLVKASKKAAEKAFVRAEERALAKGLSKSAAKAAGERAAARATKQTIKFQAAKTGARVLGDIAGASTMAATTGAMRTAADAVSRHSGDVKFDVDDKGHIVFAGHDKGDDWGTAVKKAFANTAIENFSEMFGAYLAPIGSFVGKAGEKLLNKIGLGKVTEMLRKLKASDISQAVKRLEGKVQFNGVIFGEYPEENFGGLMNALIVGDQTLDDAEGTGLFNIDNQIDTFLGVGLMGGIFSAARLGGGLVGGQGNLEARRAVRQAGVAALKDFKGKELIWDQIKTDVDNASNDQLKQVVKNIVTDGGLSDENKAAALQYVRSSMQLRGVEAIRPLTKEEEEADAHNVQEEAAHDRGFEADAQERKDIAIESEDPNNAEAQQAWAAVEQRINDDATQMAEALREKAQQTQHNDGSFHTATLKEKDEHGEGKQVFIVSGHVQMTPDGTMIDREASDKTIVIFDPSTGERKMIDPSSDFGLSSVDEPTTPEELEASIERNRQGFIQSQLDEARGTIRLSVGQQFVLPDGNEAVVVALDESGEDITAMLADGTQVNIQRAELQKAHDEQALAEYRQRKGVEEPTAEDEEPEQSEQGAQVVQVDGAPSSYEPDMELVVRNENGGESQAIVMGRVRYEGGEFVPDENGGIVEYFMDGEVRHEQIGKLNDRVVSHTDAAQVIEEEEPPAEDVQTEEETPLQEEESVPAEDDTTLLDEEELAPAAEEDAKEDNAMPMRDNGEEDWEATTPEHAHYYIFNEAGLSQREGNEFVAAQKDAAQRALNKAKSTQAPRVGTSIRQYNEAKAKHQEKIENAQRVLDYWNAVQDIQVEIQHKEREQKEAEDAKAHEEAAAQMQADFEERKAAEAERAAVGNENPMPTITEKWSNAEKVDGYSDEIVLPDGTSLKGHYVLHESGVSSPSHDAETWKMTEGFPMDANDNSVNDRDYEHDKDAQAHTEEIARNYDQRALQSVPVVSRDGVVLSGNGRTMAGELAARDNTDKAYIDYLKAYAHKFGFTPEQVEAMEHPRVSFVPDEAMPYTAETFARFNQQEMKSQSKTEQAVKLGKTVSDDAFRNIVRTINGFDTLGDFYNDPKESIGAVYDLHNTGVIPQTQLAEMVDGIRGQERLSAVGREYLENMLIGKAFANEPDVLRMLTAEPAMRQTIITALGEIVDNIALGEDWALQGELADAVKLCFEARKDGAKYGDIVSSFASQGVLFADPDQIQTKADFRNVTMLMLADALNDKRVTLLKTALQLYNNEARSSASGQTDMFAGGIQSREEILRNVINYIKENYGKSKEIEAAKAEAMERRKAESLQEDGDSEQSTEGSERRTKGTIQDGAQQVNSLKEDEDLQGKGEESPTDFTPSPRKDGEDLLDYAERVDEESKADHKRKREENKVNTSPSDAQKEAGNYKKGHIRVDGLDITIEQPKGSIRTGKDASGKEWRSEMHNTYGYIRGTESVDGDHIDIFLSDNPADGNVFVVDQVNKDGSCDEHKVMYGFADVESAKQAYLSNYEKGWQGLGNITEVSKDEFKKWIDSSKRKTKPFAEYTSVKTQDDMQTKKPTEAEDFTRQYLKELEDFQKNTDTTGRTAIDIDRYDAEDLFAPLKLDGKPSNLGVLTVVSDKITDPASQIAVYDYSDEIDDKTNSGWQKWGDLADEYNKTVDKDDKAQERGDTATLGFRTVDAAVKFNDWLNTSTQTERTEEAQTDVAAPAMTEEEYLASKGLGSPMSDHMLDKTRIPLGETARQKARREREAEKAMKEHAARKKDARKEYQEKLANGELREPTREETEKKRIDALIRTANGHEDNPSVLAARRVLDKRGIDWQKKDGQINTQTEENNAHNSEGIMREQKNVQLQQTTTTLTNDTLAKQKATEAVLTALNKAGIEVVQATEEQAQAMLGNSKAEQLKTPQGTVYGWTVNGKIYLTKDGLNPNTPIHEYTHLWADAMMKHNKKEWQSVKELLRDTPVWDEVLKDKNYQDIIDNEDAIAGEALSRISGKKNAAKMEAEAQKMIDESKDYVDKAKAISLLERMKNALEKFWDWVGKDLFGIKDFSSIDEVTDRVLHDLVNGADLEVVKSDKTEKQQVSTGSEEERAIIERAKIDGTYMKAPNGKPTNLNEKQWVQVRTKAFKNWFGDWEKAARIEKLHKSKPVKITGKEIEPSDDLKQYKKNALEYGKTLRGEYTNEDTGETIALTGGNSRGGIREILQHDYKDIEHLQSIAAIPQIIEKSTYIDEASNEDVEKYPGVKSFRYYVCGLKIGRNDYTVKAVIAVQNNGDRYYDHKLSSIEKGKLLSIIPTIQKAGIENNMPPSVGKDKRLLSILQTNSSKVVDENGEPMVVYHGTLTKDLHQFSKDFIGSRYSYDEKGFFFISNKQIAKDYSYSEFDSTRKGEVIETFLSIKHPLLVDQKWCKKNGLGNNVFKDNDAIEFWDNYQALILEESENNDGVIITDGNTTMDVAFDPNQIKSAVNNNGEFSLESDDIRFRKEDGENQEVLRDKDLSTEPLRDREAMRNEAVQLAEKLHTPVNIVEDANKITHQNKEIEARRRKAKGWYNVSTGEVVVVLANHKDAADVAATISHEVIAHKGLRELVGEERYDEFLDEVYNHLRGDLKREIDDAVGRDFLDDSTQNGDKVKTYEQHRRIAIDELFGSLAEKPFEEFSENERNLWQKIKDSVKKLLDRFLEKLKLPKWFELGDNELRYILWRSKERLERGKEDPIDQARDIVKREELGLTNEPLNKVSVTARNFDELAERNEWNPKPIQDEEMVDLYDIAPKVTTHDYYLGTKADFKLVKSTEDVWDAWEKLKQKDGFRYVHSPKSNSEYLVNDETGEIYRMSDHWGWVASCRWDIDGRAHSFDIGKANIKDFERIKGNYVFTPEAQRYEPPHKTYLRAKENLERALKDDTYKFTAAARRIAEEKVRSYQGNAEFYEQNHESGDIVYRRNEFGKYIPYREMKHGREQWFEGYISDEEREIVERAQADGSYMKAPNGKPSKLNGKQWAQVRTKAFKNWFGDWEKAARIEKLRNSEPVVISGNEYKGKYELNRDSAKAWIKENLRGEYTIADTEERIFIGRKGVNKVTSHSMGNEAHLKSLVAIPKMLEQSVFITEEKAEKPNAQYPTYRYYVAGLKIGGVDYTAKLTIGVDENGNKYYDHALTEIEKGKLLDQINDQAVDNGFMSTGAEPNPSVTIGKDTKLVSILQVNSSKVVDENGEPQVIRSADDKHIDYFLNIRHPIEASEDVVVSEIADKAVKDGYDGVHTPKGYFPFTVNQYKSAQRNNGEFSTESDDVLYRDSSETRDIWIDQSMGLHERTTAAAARLANNHRDNKVFMQDAMRAIGANLTDLRKAMRLQKDFDRTTAKRVYDLARILMEMGYLRGLNQQEVSKLLSVMKNSIGKQNIDSDVQKLMDLMVNHQLKQSKITLESLERIKGSKVNAKGVEVQGALNAEGQAIMAAMKAAKDIVTPCAGKTEEDNGELTAWGQALEDVQERISSEDKAVAENAALEYQGMLLAQQWFDEIKQSELEEATLRQELNHAPSTTPIEDRKGEAYKEYIGNLKQAIQQNKIDRAQAYMNLVGQLTESLRESIEGAKAFKLREKARISAIQRDANLDMEGRPAGEHYVPDWKARAVNNSFVSATTAPLATLDQMLRVFGNKSANGEGYLYNRFERGFIDARQQEIKGYREKTAILDAKAAEIFGGNVKTWADLIRYVSGLPGKDVVFKNDSVDEHFTLSQGNLMYIYMVNKMLDGRLKLAKMGLTDDVVEELAKEIDPRLIKLADWMQEDFLVQTRNEYNETHKRVFGASMAAIEDYFPLKIRSNARIDKAEDLDNPTKNSGITTTTGSIIKRRRNSLPLDLLNADALNIILGHITEMEHWNAFVEYNRDLNTLRTYKRFRNGVENMTTIYGSGKKLWKHFNDLCQITTGSYIPPRAALDEAAVNLAKGVTAAKVSFRLFTALKQFLSFPAYFPEVKAVHIAKCLAHPKESWDWCMENLPIFNERWNSRLSGDPRLLKTNMDWKMWRTRAAEIAMRIGMTPNAFVDALTVSIGARAMYMTRKGQYLRDGYMEEEADKRAKQDAETLYNQTQQSSEGAFLSRMQVDRGWLPVLFSIFRNSSMAYTRQLYDATRNLRRNITPGGRKESIAFMTKQYMNEGFDKAKAEENAKRKFDRQIRKDILRVATFGYILQFAWNLGAYLPYLLFGNDDDEKEVFWQDVFAHSYFGSLEGLTGGDVISQVLGSALAGNLNPNSMDKDMPLTSDLAVAFKEFTKGDTDAALSDMINLIVQSGIGVNPQSITDSVLAIMDACGDDPALANEATIFIARILQVPQSQIDKLYFDEVGLMGSGLSKYTPAQLADRYARYKVKRGHFSTPWAWDDDANYGKAITNANKEIKERTNHMGLTDLNEAFAPYEEAYKKVDKQMNIYNKIKESDYVRAANIMVEIQKDKASLDTYRKFKSMDRQLDKMAKRFLSAKSDGERQLYRKMIESYKPAMLKVLQAKGEAAQEKAMDDIGTLMEGFAEEQEKLYENQ